MKSNKELHHFTDAELLSELNDRGLSFKDIAKEWHDDFGNDSTGVKNLIESGLAYDGGHHKQYYLAQLADKLGFEFDFYYEEGIPA